LSAFQPTSLKTPPIESLSPFLSDIARLIRFETPMTILIMIENNQTSKANESSMKNQSECDKTKNLFSMTTKFTEFMKSHIIKQNTGLKELSNSTFHCVQVLDHVRLIKPELGAK
jgi:hypothetical protein